MRYLIIFFTITTIVIAKCDIYAEKLVSSYNSIKYCKNNNIVMQSGETFIYDDMRKKSFNQLLNNPDINDMFKYNYPKRFITQMPKNVDPGRVRYEPLFRAIYGNSAAEVKANLVAIKWIDGSLIRVTKKEGVSQALRAVVRDLKELPQSYLKYLTPIGGTFKWRKIAGTSRLSVHSFGAAIDIRVKYSAYWRWNKGRGYKNKIPARVVKIFEKYGFIWGGKWSHYDTMHFEYRPEFF